LVGAALAGWIAKDANFKFLTSATKAQLEMGAEISKEVSGSKDLIQTIDRSFERDKGWTEYHAETLAELVDEESPDKVRFIHAAVERKAINLWHDGYHEKAIAKIEKALAEAKDMDPQTRGWMEQLAARIADKWGNVARAQDLQREAYAHNRNLIRPKILPPYRPITAPSLQASAIVGQFGEYRLRRGFLKAYDDIVGHLHSNSSANQFEQALADLAIKIGFSSERHDVNGQGPDVLWLLPGKIGLVIEAKSRKKANNALTKEEHGQLLIAAEWFTKNYKGYQCVRVSIHPNNQATKAAGAEKSYALTYEKLTALISDARSLLTDLCESQLNGEDLVTECERLLSSSSIKPDQFVKNYLIPFEGG
jgi:hypothetical protein